MSTGLGLKELAERRGWLKWAVCLTASFAAILEVIDVSIVNVALPDMQGNLGATLTEIGWVSTGYSIANVIVIPLTAWLGLYFGKRRYFIFSLVAFVLASVLCGLAQDLPTLIIGRVLQGLGGGGLLAKAQALIFETFPKEEQAWASMIFTLGVISGPAFGPALGGYLTDQLGWRWIFFINVPMGILAVIMSSEFLPHDTRSPNQKVLKGTDVDWLGIGLLSLGLGALQVVLEEGQRDDWFSSSFIVAMFWTSIVSSAWFIWHEQHVAHPAVNLSVLKYRAVAAGSTISLVVGMGLYGTIFVVPVFAQNVLQFTATKTGLLLIPGALASGLGTFFLYPILKRTGPRILIACGCCITLLAMASLSTINTDTGESNIYWPLILRGFGGVMMFVPLSMATLGSIPKEDVAAASGFFSLTRQLGGSLGIAAITTLVERMQGEHRGQLVYGVNELNPAYADRISAAKAMFTPWSADSTHVQAQALELIDHAVALQSALLSYRDVFYFVGAIFIGTLPMILLLGGVKKPAPAMVATPKPEEPAAPMPAEMEEAVLE